MRRLIFLFLLAFIAIAGILSYEFADEVSAVIQNPKEFQGIALERIEVGINKFYKETSYSRLEKILAEKFGACRFVDQPSRKFLFNSFLPTDIKNSRNSTVAKCRFRDHPPVNLSWNEFTIAKVLRHPGRPPVIDLTAGDIFIFAESLDVAIKLPHTYIRIRSKKRAGFRIWRNPERATLEFGVRMGNIALSQEARNFSAGRAIGVKISTSRGSSLTHGQKTISGEAGSGTLTPSGIY